MTSHYFLNIVGCKRDEEQLLDIPHPRFELVFHATTKTTQTGALLGMAFVAPIVSLAQGKRDLSSVRSNAFEYGSKGAIAGLLLGPLATYAFLKLRTSGTAQERYDLAYRVRCNKTQPRADRLSIVGAATGLGLAGYLGEELAKGALFGFAGGCLLSGIFSTVFRM